MTLGLTNMKHFWIVDVVTAAGLISVIEKPWGDESLRGTVLWGTLAQDI